MGYFTYPNGRTRKATAREDREMNAFFSNNYYRKKRKKSKRR